MFNITKGYFHNTVLNSSSPSPGTYVWVTSAALAENLDLRIEQLGLTLFLRPRMSLVKTPLAPTDMEPECRFPGLPLINVLIKNFNVLFFFPK